MGGGLESLCLLCKLTKGEILMKTDQYQKGFTLTELIIVVWGIIVLSLIGFGLYVAWHFVSKFW
jgi:hypothetical protein